MRNTQGFQDVKAVLSRLFMGRVSVKGGSFKTLRQADTKKLSRTISIYSLPGRKKEEVLSSSVFASSAECHSSRVARLGREGCPVHAGLGKVDCGMVYILPCGFSAVVSGDFSPRKHIRVFAALDVILPMPQKRKNLVGYLRSRFPEGSKTGILALFSPVVRSCVRKTALDKSKGTLDVWMDSRKAGMHPHHLLLIRVPGETRLKWVWMEAGKNDNIFGGGVG